MDPNLLVAVWSKHPDWKKPKRAAGYPIAPNRILTVAHVIPPDHDEAEIAIEFVYTPSRTAVRGRRVWWNGREQSADGLDAAVVECVFPEGVHPTGHLVNAMPSERTKWFANCIPQFSIDNKGLPGGYLDTAGYFNPGPDVASLQIECDLKRLEGPTWGGASGTPFFIGPHRIAGIVSEVAIEGASKQKVKQGDDPIQRLVAVPAWRIVEAPGFLASLGGISDEEFAHADGDWKRTLGIRLRAELRSLTDPLFATLFEQVFGVALPKSEDELTELSVQIAGQDGLANSIDDLREKCRNAGLTDEVERLDRLEDDLIPTLFPAAERREFWNKLEFQSVICVEHAVKCSTTAEARMAASDRRATRYLSGETADEVTELKGAAALSFKAIKPGSLTAEQVAFRVLLEMCRDRLSPAQFPSTDDARNEVRTGKISDETIDSLQAHREQLSQSLTATLKQRRSRYGSPYCIFRSDETGVPRDRLLQALSVVKGWVPQVRFLEISATPSHGVTEDFVLERIRLNQQDRQR